MRSAARESESTGRVMRRDAHQPTTAATSRPPSSETPTNFINVSHVSRSTVFGFATTSVPNVVPSSATGDPTAMYGRSSSGGVNSNVTDSPARIVRASIRPRGQAAQAGGLAREERQARVVDPVARGPLELGADERRRDPALVARLDRLLRVEARQPAGLPAQLLQRVVLRVALEEPEGDGGGDDAREHVLPRGTGRAAGSGASGTWPA